MAQGIERGLDVADVYAAALFELARERGVLDAVRAELEELLRLARENREFAALCVTAAISLEKRAVLLERIFRGRLSDLVLDTLQVMNRHDRLSLVPALLRAFVLRIEDARGQVEVTATSAVALAADQQAEIERLAAELSGRKPLIEYRVEPEILGGLILQVGDYRYDNSLRRHLHVARGRLLERTARGAEWKTESAR